MLHILSRSYSPEAIAAMTAAYDNSANPFQRG